MKNVIIIFCIAVISCNRNKCQDISFSKKTFETLIKENLKIVSNEMPAGIIFFSKINDTTKIRLSSEVPHDIPDFIKNVDDKIHSATCQILSINDNIIKVPRSYKDSVKISISCFANPKLDSIDKFYQFYISNEEVPMAETAKTRIFLLGNLMYKIVVFSKDSSEVNLLSIKLSKILYRNFIQISSTNYCKCINKKITLKEVYKPISY